jgi:hypothetical protein
MRAHLPLTRAPVFLVLVFVTAGPLATRSLFAHDIDETWTVSGLSRVHLTAWEQMEDLEGLTQHPSGDEASTSTTGFSLGALRFGVEARLLEERLTLCSVVRFERSPAVLDAWFNWSFFEWLRIKVGQQIIPATWESAVTYGHLDFVLRGRTTSRLADYALSRTTYASSLFFGNKTWRRDLGASVLGDVDLQIGTLRYHLMAGNGLGSNLYIGGSTSPQFILANKPQLFYGGRVDLLDLFGWIRLGGHVTYNRHDDMVFNSGRVVYDLDRQSGSTDVGVRIPGTGLALHALHARGVIHDDFDDDGKTDYRFRAWEARVIWRLNPMLAWLTSSGWLDDHALDLAFRWEAFTDESDESGVEVTATDWTAGATWSYLERIRVQVNYVARRTEDPYKPDLADDVLLVNIQTDF